MKASIVKVVGSEIKRGFMIIKTLFGKTDVQTSYNTSPYGIDSNPVKNMRAIYSKSINGRDTIIIGYINQDCIASEGETRIFSQNFAIHLKDGFCEVGGDSDNMIRYSKMEDAFLTLRGDLNDLINKFNVHTQPVTGAVAGAPTTQALVSTVEMDAAKINEVKTL